MISWIQRTFHRHFRLVFLLVLAAMAVPLIVIFSPSSGVGRAGNKLLERAFFGINLDNAEQARRVFGDGSLSAQLSSGYTLREGQLERYSLKRVAGLALADQLHLPAPTPEQLSKYVLTLQAFQDQNGLFDQKRYNTFADSLKTGTGLTVADVNRVLRDDVRLEALAKIIGGPGYVMPGDVRQQLIVADSTWSAQVATLAYATFNPTVAATDEVLKKYHDDNAFLYEVPQRPRVSFVAFPADEFAPPVGPTEAELRAYYTANSARFPVPPDPAEKNDAATPPDNFPKVRAQVETALKAAAGLRGASKAANDFTIALYERKLAANSPELAAFLVAQHRQPTPIPPFAPDSPPANLPWLAGHGEQISRLGKERFFSDPLTGANGYVVLLWNETLPPYKPSFAEVRERVATDHKEAEKRRLFIARGQALHTELQAAAKSADGFEKTATAEKLEVKTYASFTLRRPPTDMPTQAVSLLSRLEAGQVSEMVADGDKGYLVFAREKKLPDLSPGNPRYVEMQKQIMGYTANVNQSSYLEGLVEQELKKTEPAQP